MLTDAQRQLATQWHGLIYSYADKHHINRYQWYDVLAIGLCHAAETFNTNLGYKFATYAYVCMGHELCKQLHRAKLKKAVPKEKVTSYNRIVIGPHDTPTEYRELMDSGLESCRIDYTRLEVEEFRNTLVGLRLAVFDALMTGYDGAKTGRLLNLSKERIRQIKKELQQKWLEYSAA